MHGGHGGGGRRRGGSGAAAAAGVPATQPIRGLPKPTAAMLQKNPQIALFHGLNIPSERNVALGSYTTFGNLGGTQV